MNLSKWQHLTKAQKLITIKKNGKGLNHKAMAESLPYITAAISHLDHVKNCERLPRYSMKATAEHLRFRDTASDGSKLFKVNNNLSADINHFTI